MNSANPVRIVLVEDNSADVFLIEESLRQHGIDFEMRRFDDGDKALDHLHQAPRAEGGLPDLVMLDLHLPGTDGTEILKSIRDDIHLSAVPVVVLTGAQREHLGHLDLSRACIVVHKSMNLDEYLRDVGQVVVEVQLAEKLRRLGAGNSGQSRGLGAQAVE